MTGALLNRIGLFLGLIGVILIFIWGPPQPSLEEGVEFGLEDETPLEDGRTVSLHNEDVRRLRARHHLLSRVGLTLIGVGFFAQFAATFE